MKRTETMWAIAGVRGNGAEYLYCGTSLTRRDVVADHEAATGRSWKELHRCGDRAVKVTLTWDAKK